MEIELRSRDVRNRILFLASIDASTITRTTSRIALAKHGRYVVPQDMRNDACQAFGEVFRVGEGATARAQIRNVVARPRLRTVTSFFVYAEGTSAFVSTTGTGVPGGLMRCGAQGDRLGGAVRSSHGDISTKPGRSAINPYHFTGYRSACIGASALSSRIPRTAFAKHGW